MALKILVRLGLAPVPLSRATEERLNVLFHGKDRRRAMEIISWLPSAFPKDPVVLERIRFALLKLSNGRISDLEEWKDELRNDYRTILVESGFWHDAQAHLSWFPNGPGLESRPPLNERVPFTKEQRESARESGEQRRLSDE